MRAVPSLPPSAFRTRGARADVLGSIVRAVVGALPALLLVPVALSAQAPDSVLVDDIDFVGASAFDDAVLRTAIVTSETRCANALIPLCWLGIGVRDEYVDARTLGADVVRLRIFYFERGYRQARVELDTLRQDDELEVRFRIDEGRPVRVSSIALTDGDSLPAALAADLPLRSGAPLSLIDYEAARDTLRTRLHDYGYASADVLASYLIPADSPYQAQVEYQLLAGEPAVFGTIVIEGAEDISPAVVRRMLAFREGEAYSQRALLESQRNLFALEAFRAAEITPAPQDSANHVAVHVRVVEGPLRRVRFGLGLNSVDYLNAELSWAHRNFLGGARQLTIGGRVSNLLTSPLDLIPYFEDVSGIYESVAGRLGADFRQPWFFHPRNTLGTGLFIERYNVPQVFVRTSRGGYVSVARVLRRPGTVTVGYRPELTELDSDGDLIFCINFVACERRDINILREAHWLAPLSASFSRDRSNNLFAPTRGYRLRADAEFAARATGSEFAYARLLGDLSVYRELLPGVVLATRVSPGWARSITEPGAGLGLHPQKRFFAGGPNSVRGFAQYRLGPRILTVNAARVLADTSLWTGCSAQSINRGVCNAGELARDRPGEFEVRPVGGAVSFEGSAELRTPLYGENLRAAFFLDVGQVWQEAGVVRPSDLVWSPGLGVRYFSPVGPIRIDMGYNTRGAERLRVVTTEVCTVRPACGPIEEDVVYSASELQNQGRLRPLPTVVFDRFDSWTDRLQLHFSIGQAF